ncbi:MAG: hypothetical protein NDP16_05870 [Crenarchaeota archaeon]|nr:hypothetical protein [Thermoproteota archaeon]
MAIVEFLDPSYVKIRLDNLDITLSSLRDSIRGTDNRTLTDIYSIGTAIRDRLPASLTAAGNLKIAILEDTVGIAKDTTLSNILSKLDVNLSTRASETTLTAIRDRLPSSLTAAGNFKVALLEDSAGIAKDSTLSSILSKLDVNLSTRLSESTFTSRVPALSTQTIDIGGSSYAALNVVPSIGGAISRMPYMIDNINVTTTESSTSIASPGAKIVQITNKGDVDCLIGINASVPTTNPLKVRARCSLIFVFKSVTSIYYKTASGSTTIAITYFN